MASRVALVTGAAQGIGEAIAIRLAADPSGIDVAVSDVAAKQAQLDDLVTRIQATGRKAVAIICDVTSEEQVKATIDKAVEVLGGLDIVSIERLLQYSVYSTRPENRWWLTQEFNLSEPCLIVSLLVPSGIPYGHLTGP